MLTRSLACTIWILCCTLGASAQALPGLPPLPCLTARQRLRLADSLQSLPRARAAARKFQHSADSAMETARVNWRTAYALAAEADQQTALRLKAEGEAVKWRHKARARGWRTFGVGVLGAVAGFILYKID